MTGLRTLIIFAIIGYVFGSNLTQPRPDEGPDDEDKKLTTLQIIRKYGYPAEDHEVVTEDGYILHLHRIPYGKLSPKNQTKKVVLLQHGLLCSSMDFVVTGTKRGLAYVLADSGFDVWMPNSRGSTYSNTHVSLSNTSREYWNFTWHEMGVYDTPASIDFILNKTGVEKVHYVGHSQGTTSFFVFASIRQDYADKVVAAFLLAPIAFEGKSKSLLLKTLSVGEPLLGPAEKAGYGQFVPARDLLTKANSQFCDIQPVTPYLCEGPIFILFGFDSEQINKTTLPVILAHYPDTASTKQIRHYAQSFNTDKFRQFDYGPIRNEQGYGQIDPPNYNIGKIKIPMIIFYALNDWVASIEDVKKLFNRLDKSYLKETILVKYDKFNHVDYLYAKDILSLVYDPLVGQMNKY